MTKHKKLLHAFVVLIEVLEPSKFVFAFSIEGRFVSLVS